MKQFKITFEKDLLFYIGIITLLLLVIIGLLGAFITCVHAGYFRYNLPGEWCDPVNSKDCAPGLVCEVHDETSHPFHHVPDPTNPDKQYICQLPRKLRLDKMKCTGYCDECLPITKDSELAVQVVSQDKRKIWYFILGTIGLFVIGIIIFFIYKEETISKVKEFDFDSFY